MSDRLTRAKAIADELAALDDEETMDLLYGSRVVGVGIGGTTRVAQFRGSKVFIKQMPLTAEQNLAPTATRSWLDLPVTSHYGLVRNENGPLSSAGPNLFGKRQRISDFLIRSDRKRSNDRA